MQLTGLLYGAELLSHVEFAVIEVLGPTASETELQSMLDVHGQIFVKPVFKGGIGKKGKAGLGGRATTIRDAISEKERLYFAEHVHGNATAKSNPMSTDS